MRFSIIFIILNIFLSLKAMDVVDLTTQFSGMAAPSSVASLTEVFFSPNIKDQLLFYIKNEQKSIRMAIYELNDGDIVNALIARKRDGIEITVVMNNSKNVQNIKTQLAPYNVPVYFNNQRFSETCGYETMHEKFVLFEKNIDDKPLVWYGSYNFTSSANSWQWNNAVIDDSTQKQREFSEEWETLLNKSEKNGENVLVPRQNGAVVSPLREAYFSPFMVSDLLKNFIAQERVGIEAAYFRFTLYPVAQAMVERKKAVPLKIDITVDKGYRKDYCEALALLKSNEVLVCSNKDNKIMHHKFIIFEKNKDDKSIVVSGSYNPTGIAEQNSWENACIISEPHIIDKFKAEYNCIKQCRVEIPLHLLICTAKKSDYSKRMNGIPGY